MIMMRPLTKNRLIRLYIGLIVFMFAVLLLSSCNSVEYNEYMKSLKSYPQVCRYDQVEYCEGTHNLECVCVSRHQFERFNENLF